MIYIKVNITSTFRGYYCGACLAEYYVEGRWQQCPNPGKKS